MTYTIYFAVCVYSKRLVLPTPLAYKKNNGLPYAKKGYADKADCKWSATTIIRILQDETYHGGRSPDELP